MIRYCFFVEIQVNITTISFSIENRKLEHRVGQAIFEKKSFTPNLHIANITNIISDFLNTHFKDTITVKHRVRTEITCKLLPINPIITFNMLNLGVKNHKPT